MLAVVALIKPINDDDEFHLPVVSFIFDICVGMLTDASKIKIIIQKDAAI
jgi:hypothetical protein